MADVCGLSCQWLPMLLAIHSRVHFGDVCVLFCGSALLCCKHFLCPIQAGFSDGPDMLAFTHAFMIISPSPCLSMSTYGPDVYFCFSSHVCVCVFRSAAFINELFHVFIFFLFLEEGPKSSHLPYHPREILLTQHQCICGPTRNEVGF